MSERLSLEPTFDPREGSHKFGVLYLVLVLKSWKRLTKNVILNACCRKEIIVKFGCHDSSFRLKHHNCTVAFKSLKEKQNLISVNPRVIENFTKH